MESFLEAKKLFMNFASSVAKLSTASYCEKADFALSYLRNVAQKELTTELLHRAQLLILHVERQIALDVEQTVQNIHIRQLVQSAIEMPELRHLQKLDSDPFPRHFDR